MAFDYYYGKEAEQYSFYRIPKSLFVEDIFKELSIESKILYGILLDRMGLSVKKGWIDEQNRAFIHFTIDEVCSMLGYANKKAIKVLAELSDFGLIEKKRLGMGKPSRLYVKNFLIVVNTKKCQNDISESVETTPQEVSNEHFKKCQNDISRCVETTFQEVSNEHFKKCQNDISRSVEMTFQEVSKAHCNKTKDNKTDINNNKGINIYQSINPSINQLEAVKVYEEIIKANINYELLCAEFNLDVVTEITNLIIATLCSTQKTYKINQEVLPADKVKKQFLALRLDHIAQTIINLQQAVNIKNMKNYMLTALYNSIFTAKHEWQADYNSIRMQSIN